MTTVTISLRDGSIVCAPKQGNLRVGPKGTVTWQTPGKGQLFRLTFYLQPFEGMPSRSGDWPFDGPPPPTAPSTDWCDSFTATAGGDGVFKYAVEMKDSDGSLVRLDPIIIIRN